jgi:hypothetical protein
MAHDTDGFPDDFTNETLEVGGWRFRVLLEPEGAAGWHTLEVYGQETGRASRLRPHWRRGILHDAPPEGERLRSFRFGAARRHVENFCAKWARDPDYREASRRGETEWALCDRLFVRNAGRQWAWAPRYRCGDDLGDLEGRDPRRVLRARQRLFDRYREADQDLHDCLERNLRRLSADPDYQRVLAADRRVGCKRTSRPDPGIACAAWLLARLPGFTLVSACQGTEGLVALEDRRLLVPSWHAEIAFVEFAATEDAPIGRLAAATDPYPGVDLVLAGRPVESRDHPRRNHRLQACSADTNLVFRQELLALAEELTGEPVEIPAAIAEALACPS